MEQDSETPAWEYTPGSHILAISPHLDDAVLSIGATLHTAASKGKVTVFTVFAGIPEEPFSPVARRAHDIWGLHEEPVHRRRKEDLEALKLIEASAKHGDFLDFLYRKNWNTTSEINLKAAETDSKLLSNVSGAIASCVKTVQPDAVLTCAAVGDHPDHRHTRDALLSLRNEIDVPIALWQDLPYALDNARPASLPPDVPLTGQIAARSDSSSWETKYDAIECYTSQQSMLWHGDDFRKILSDHALSQASDHNHDARVELFWRIG